jgi:hypothetical protein
MCVCMWLGERPVVGMRNDCGGDGVCAGGGGTTTMTTTTQRHAMRCARHAQTEPTLLFFPFLSVGATLHHSSGVSGGAHGAAASGGAGPPRQLPGMDGRVGGCWDGVGGWADGWMDGRWATQKAPSAPLSPYALSPSPPATKHTQEAGMRAIVPLEALAAVQPPASVLHPSSLGSVLGQSLIQTVSEVALGSCGVALWCGAFV